MKEAGNNLSAASISGYLKDINRGMTVVPSGFDSAPLQVYTIPSIQSEWLIVLGASETGFK